MTTAPYLAYIKVTAHKTSAPWIDGEISDVIERLVDWLDELDCEPGVGTERDGHFLHLTIELMVAGATPLEALTNASRIVTDATEAAGLNPIERRAEARILEPA